MAPQCINWQEKIDTWNANHVEKVTSIKDLIEVVYGKVGNFPEAGRMLGVSSETLRTQAHKQGIEIFMRCGIKVKSKAKTKTKQPSHKYTLSLCKSINREEKEKLEQEGKKRNWNYNCQRCESFGRKTKLEYPNRINCPKCQKIIFACHDTTMMGDVIFTSSGHHARAL